MLLLVFLSLIPALALILYSSVELHDRAVTEANADALRVARRTAATQSLLFAGARQLITGLAQGSEIHGHDSATCSREFANIRDRFPLYTNLGAALPNGEIFCSAEPLAAGTSLADEAAFQASVKLRDFAIGGFSADRISSRPSIILTYPSVDPQGVLQAMVFAGLDPSRLSEVAAEDRLPPSASFTMADAGGTILARYPSAQKWLGKSTSETPLFKLIFERGQSVAESIGIEGDTRIYAFAPLPGEPRFQSIHVSIGVPRDTVLRMPNLVIYQSLVWLGIVTMLIFAAVWYGSDFFVLRQVNALVHATREIATGNLSARTGVSRGTGELSLLARSFDQMTDSLEQQINERKGAEKRLRIQARELEKANLELREASRVKDQFLSVMSHELRTPLNVVLGYTEMIRDGLLGEINETQKEGLGKVTKRAADLLSMITDILQATHLEARDITVQRCAVDLNDFLKNMRSGYDAPLGNGLSVLWDYPPDLPPMITDAEKLKHILRNLIHNAAKFTEKGTITISARIRRQAEGNRQQSSTLTPAVSRLTPGQVEFKVSDTGIGIAQETLPVIFDKFRQADSSETRIYGGVGLGLYIVKKFTEMLGGTVEVESELGKGSTFTVTIPLEQ